jgi:hypothetical protein
MGLVAFLAGPDRGLGNVHEELNLLYDIFHLINIT